VAVYSYSVPGWYFFESIFAFWLWIALCTIWLGRLLIATAMRRSIRLPRWKHWLVTPAAGALTLGLVVSLAPLKVRYYLSRDAMNSAAQTVIANPAKASTIREIGLWDVERVERISGGMRFLVQDTGFLDPVGFAYSPNRQPEVIGEDTYVHFDGPWYIWEESW
jgi:hypothetical protein